MCSDPVCNPQEPCWWCCFLNLCTWSRCSWCGGSTATTTTCRTASMMTAGAAPIAPCRPSAPGSSSKVSWSAACPLTGRSSRSNKSDCRSTEHCHWRLFLKPWQPRCLSPSAPDLSWCWRQAGVLPGVSSVDRIHWGPNCSEPFARDHVQDPVCEVGLTWTQHPVKAY